MLSALIYDWDGEAAGAILGRCTEAAGATAPCCPGEDRRRRCVATHRDGPTDVLVYFGGKVRGVAERTAMRNGDDS